MGCGAFQREWMKGRGSPREAGAVEGTELQSCLVKVSAGGKNTMAVEWGDTAGRSFYSPVW